MRIDDGKVLFLCNTCSYWFYDQNKEYSACPECSKAIQKFRNNYDRHREQCNNCKKVFETQKKSPYENSHFLNCDNCMTVLKLSYSDSVLQKYSNNVGLYTQNIGKNEVEEYWHEIEPHLNKCLCGGTFKHETNKKCPFCLHELSGITKDYIMVNNTREKVIIPVISKHIWKSDFEMRKNILSSENTDPILQDLIKFMKVIKYLEEKYYENTMSWCDSLDKLKNYKKSDVFIKMYSFDELKTNLEQTFTFDFQIFEDTFHFIAHYTNNKKTTSYLLNGKTGDIEIHTIT